MTRPLLILVILSILGFTVNASKGKGSDSMDYAVKTVCRRFSNVYPVDGRASSCSEVIDEHGMETGRISSVGPSPFPHPSKGCTECRCCKTGKVKCYKRPCATKQPPKCGMKFQVATESDGCCTACNTTCVAIQNSVTLNCPKNIIYFDKDDTSEAGCTGVCGCKFRGHIVPNGVITDPNVVYPCEQCTCANGEVQCSQQASCPAEKLHCVNPVVDQNTCLWTCPDGPSCWKGDEVMFANMTYDVGGKYCTCILDPWWPYAACGNQGHEAVFERMLQDEMCVATAINPISYNAA